jgi:WD40 repeat protein
LSSLCAFAPLREVSAKITDFGLAKLLEAEPAASASGCRTRDWSVLGTASYMAPEQAAGRNRDTGPATDVYGLGAILYELLTGRPPFRAATPLDTLEQVRTREPSAPGRLRAGVPRDLNVICLKCLEKEPRRRYASAEEFADDLKRFLDGDTIRARRASAPERVGRWCRRNPRVAGLLALVVLALAAVTWQWRRAEAHRTEAEHQRDLARAEGQSRRRENVLQELQLLRLTPHEDGWSDRAWTLVTLAARLGPDGRVGAQGAASLAGMDARRCQCFEGVGASALAFDASGRRLLLGGTAARGESRCESAKLWDGVTGGLHVSRQAGPGPVAFREDGTPLQLVAGEGPSLLVWDVAGQRAVSVCRTETDNASGVTALALSPEGSLVAASLGGSDDGGAVLVWDSATGKRLAWLPGGADALAFTPRRDLLATAGAGGRVVLWSVREGKQVAALPARRTEVRGLAFSPDGRLLAAGGSGGTLTVWDWQTGLPVSRGLGYPYDVYAVAFSPDGATLAMCGRGTTRLLDVATGRLLLDLRTDDYSAALAFSPDGRRLAVGNRGTPYRPGKVSVWELEDGRGLQTLRGLASQVARVVFSPDGRLLAALAHNWQVAVWERDGGRLRCVLDAPRGVYADNAALAFSPCGRRLAFATGTEALLWDTATGAALRSWTLPPGLADALAFAGPDRLLLFRVETLDGRLPPVHAADYRQHPRVCRLRDLLGSNRLIAEIPDFNRQVFSNRAAPDGSCFVVEGIREDGKGVRRSLKAIDAATGAEWWSRTLARTVPSGVQSVDPTGRILYAQLGDPSEAGTLLDLRSGVTLETVSPAQHGLGPGARLVVTPRPAEPSDTQPGYALWRRGEGSPLVILGIDGGYSCWPQFSRDGRLLAWGNAEGTVTVAQLDRVQERLASVGLGW